MSVQLLVKIPDREVTSGGKDMVNEAGTDEGIRGDMMEALSGTRDLTAETGTESPTELTDSTDATERPLIQSLTTTVIPNCHTELQSWYCDGDHVGAAACEIPDREVTSGGKDMVNELSC